MHWLREHGVIGSYRDYEDLPVSVLDDCRLLMEAESSSARQKARHA